MKENNDQKRKQRSKWVALMNIPFQMGIIIFAFTYLGIWLDGKYSNGSSLWTIILSLFSVFIALYNVIRQVKDLNK